MPNGATRRASKALSAAMVRAVQEPGKYHDGGGTGLYLRVDPNGSRFWVQRVTIHGKRCELGLGSPPLVPLAEARDKATDNKRIVRAGGDPLSEKRATRSTLTFSEAVEQYLEGKMAEFRNEKHCKQWRATLSTYAMPKIGRMQVETIEVRDVLRVLEPIWTTKTETASRLRGRIENVMSWAAVAGYRTGDNPARWKGNLAEILPKPSKVTKGGNHPALALVDAPEWWRSLARREGMAAQALQFLTLTTARSGEVRGMAWDELDLGTDDGSDARAIATTATWTIPATRMKGEREHRVALTPQAVAILRALPRLDGNPYVFFAPRGGMLSDMSISAVMRRMQESEVKAGRAGFVDPRNKRAAVPHGLRSTFRQWAAEQGYPRDMAEIALAHFIGSEVERAYQRSDMLERRRAMMADWAGFLRGEAAQGDAVVKLGAAG
ncbi:Prophage integrase IntA [Roseibaca ekhonensis]|uniref:Integrase n=2 Tax=Rhodobacterales TaxID=204455 RepID=A0A0L6CZS2_9RHOB|nr:MULTISPECIES: site-specific integrase [Rhodobacterales]KNX43211.1 Prophage CP4-57 integrase [Roseovarius tolerans]SEM03106.1 Integrase [Roseovarius tolerans]SUZ33734.1 Prophage integrase IntA [Roseibaca ekhonensis]